jgi:hypothetical protein
LRDLRQLARQVAQLRRRAHDADGDQQQAVHDADGHRAMARQRPHALHQPHEGIEQVCEEHGEGQEDEDVAQQIEKGEHRGEHEHGQRHPRRTRIQSEPPRHGSP